jgi:hypothetical protein
MKTDRDAEKTTIRARAEDCEDRDCEDANGVGGHGMAMQCENKAR